MSKGSSLQPLRSQPISSRRSVRISGVGERPIATALRLARLVRMQCGSWSTATTQSAPRCSASQPITPLPLQRSSHRQSCKRGARIFITASRTLEVVGRAERPPGLSKRRPPLRRSCPPPLIGWARPRAAARPTSVAAFVLRHRTTSPDGTGRLRVGLSRPWQSPLDRRRLPWLSSHCGR